MLCCSISSWLIFSLRSTSWVFCCFLLSFFSFHYLSSYCIFAWLNCWWSNVLWYQCHWKICQRDWAEYKYLLILDFHELGLVPSQLPHSLSARRSFYQGGPDFRNCISPAQYSNLHEPFKDFCEYRYAQIKCTQSSWCACPLKTAIVQL